MSKSLWLNIFRLIKSTKGRFISLTSIVAIGVAFFVGVSATSPVMGYSVDSYNDEYKLKDFTIYSNYGFDEDDINNLKEVDGISKVEGAWFADVLATSENSTFITRIHSYNQHNLINQIKLKDGRLPQNKNEALAECGTELVQGFPIGSKVSFSFPNNTSNDSLLIDEVTVVGTVDAPLYLNETKENSTLSNQYISTYLYVPNDAFDNEFYLELNITSDKLQSIYSFSDEYENYSDEIKEELKRFAKEHENDRVNKIRDEAYGDYEKGLKEYLDAEKEFKDKIDEASEEIEEGEKELTEGEEELAKAEQELRNSQDSLNKEQQAALEEINNGRKTLEEAKETLAKETNEFNNKKIELNQQKEELNNNLIEIDNAEKQLNNVINIIHKNINNKYISADTNVASFFYDVEVIKKAYEDLKLDNQLSINQLNETLNTNITQLNELSNLVNSLNQDELVNESEGLMMIKANSPELHGMISSGLNKDSKVKDYNGALNQMLEGLKIYSVSSSKYNDFSLQELVGASTELNQALSGLGGNGDTSATFKSILDTLNNQITEFNTNREAINDGINQIDSGIAEGETKLQEAQEEITKNENDLNNALIELNKKIQEAQLMIDNGAGTIAQNRYDLYSAYNALAEAKEELEAKKIDGEKELAKAKKELEEAKEKIDEIEDNEWIVLNRKEHYASVTYKNTVKQMKAIGNAFPIFFILVAALVCLTTMTRMVDEQRGELGVLRALGYTRMQCALKYLIYAFIATILGSLIGVVLGMMIFPAVIYNTWRMMYILPEIKLYIPFNLIIISILSFMAGMLLTTWFVCNSDMKEVPSQLMRPKAPKLGKTILLEKINIIWKHLSFTWKVTIRNIVRYKRRFIMTIIGVAGCTALLVTGFGIRDSINSMVDVQFYDIYKYDGVINLEKSLPSKNIEALYNEIKNRDDIDEIAICSSYSALAKSNNGIDETVYVEVFENNEEIHKVYNLRNRLTKESISLVDTGIIINEKLAENLNLDVGDSIRLEAENGVIKDIPISAITEMYIKHYAFISEVCYETYFESKCRSKSFLVKVEGDSEINQRFQSFIVENDDVDSIEFFDAILDNFNNMVKGLNLVIWTLIISSMALAFVVLGNLINVNISERQREIATIKVLGFRRKEVTNYIYKENNVLVILGSLLGIPVGNYLHHYIMRMVEMDYVMFGRSVKTLSFLQAVILTFIFGLLVNILMSNKIRNVQMVESLKSVE